MILSVAEYSVSVPLRLNRPRFDQQQRARPGTPESERFEAGRAGESRTAPGE
jgi:hypothetical protein